MKLTLNLLLAGLLAGSPLAAFVAHSTAPPPARYCKPLAFKDYEVGLGRAAIVRPASDCGALGSLIRKVSDLSGTIYTPVYVPPNISILARPKIWLFASHLEYTLDGKIWFYLRLIP